MQKIFIILLLTISTLASAEQNSYINMALSSIEQLKSNTISYKAYNNHYYSHINNKKKALIVLTGVAEPAIKYWQLIDEHKNNYDLFFWDHINQGASPDLIKDMDYRKVHVDSFETYQETFYHFFKSIKNKYADIDVISHSTGSHIAFKHLLKHPDSINKHIAITPLIDVKSIYIPDWFSKFILKVFYKKTDWAPTQTNKNADFSYFTSSKENFNNYLQLIKKHFPTQLSTGVTAGWLLLAIDSIKEFKKNNTSIATPTLLFTGGDDKVVSSKAAKKYCKKMIDCNNIHFEKGKHQLLIETDDIRLDIYKSIKQFLN